MQKKVRIVIPVILLLIFILYWALVYVLVSASLVPGFMKKLDAFEELTTKNYSEQVHTSEITENYRSAWSETKEWFAEVSKEKVALQSADGYTLVAASFETAADTHRYVLMLHGYTGWKEEMYRYAMWYEEHGYHVLVPDLRCQGESEGDFIGMGYTDAEDCMRWVEWILTKDPQAEIILHGQSMGAACALILSGREELPENVIAVISECSYTDAYSMFGDKCTAWFHLPAFPLVDSAVLMLKLRGGYDLRKASALEAVKQSTVPTLFIHGTDDAMISVNMAYELYEAAACEKELYIVEGAGHAQCADKEPEGFYASIEAFLAEK